MGIGGGGDVVGALAVAESIRARGGSAVIGGVTWERTPVDPLPGPRRLDELSGTGEVLHEAVAVAVPDTTGPGGFHFAESHMAALTGEPVVLVDPNPGPRAVGAGLAAAAARFDCDLVVLADVGGDVLAHGGEPTLGSPLCDAVLLAAARHMPVDGATALGAVFGPGCDGELTHAEVLARLAELAAADGLLGVTGIPPEALPGLEAAVERIPTEASLAAVRCARGALGAMPIRRGVRTVPLSPLGALTFFYDPERAMRSAARLAAAVADAADLADAQARLNALGVRTELDYEHDRARAAAR